MKTLVRIAYLAATGLVIARVPIASEIHSIQPVGLTVHEWGTFTSVAGEDGSAVEWNTLGCNSELPRFVNDYGYRGFKLNLSGTVRMETPVLYFYTSRELDAHVKVVFPQGLITEWYPQADYQVYLTSQADGSKHRMPPGLIWIDPSMRRLTGALEWKNVKVQPGTMPELPVEKDANHYYSAREVDAAPITVGGQHEKFLFYRGVGHFPVPLSVLVAADGKIVVENRGREPVPRVILFENRGGRLGFRIAGQVQDRVTIDAPSLDGSFPQLRQDLETALVAQGQFPKEAKAMVETWRGFWVGGGSAFVYLCPS